MEHFGSFGEALDFSCCTRFEFSVVINHMAYTWSNEALTFIPLGIAPKVDLKVRRTYGTGAVKQ